MRPEGRTEESTMTQRVTPPGTSRVFYGWISLAGAVLVSFVGSGAFVYSYGVFLPVICNEFGWSRTVVASGLSLGLLTFGLPGPLAGVRVSRFGPRSNIVLGNLLITLGMAGMFLIQEVWHVYLFYGLAGLGICFGGYVPCTAVVNNWFIRKRSLTMGILLAAAGLGGFVFPPLATVLISSFGWRMSWLVLAGIIFVVACLIGGLILIRNKPEDMGQVPDGISVKPSVEAGTIDYPSGIGEEPVGWRVGQALRQPVTWLIAVFGAANYFVLGTMVGHQVAYIRDLGFSPVAAAMTMSLFSGFSVIARLGFGAMALRYDMKNLTLDETWKLSSPYVLYSRIY